MDIAPAKGELARLGHLYGVLIVRKYDHVHMSNLESSFRNSPEVLTARLLYNHRLSAPEPFEESDEYKVAIQAYNRARSPLRPLRRPLAFTAGLYLLSSLACAFGLSQFCLGETIKTLLIQGEPHPGLAFVNPVRNG